MNQATRKPTTVGDILLFEYLEPLELKINDLAEMLHRMINVTHIAWDDKCYPNSLR